MFRSQFPRPTFLCELLSFIVIAPGVSLFVYWLLQLRLPLLVAAGVIVFWILAIGLDLLPHLAARHLARLALAWDWAQEVFVTRGPQPPAPPLVPPAEPPPFS
jgi:hypothetical protein